MKDDNNSHRVKKRGKRKIEIKVKTRRLKERGGGEITIEEMVERVER